MNGAESLVATLSKGGVNVCFTNPGTSEMHFVAALDVIPGVRCVLGLYEGVVTGAADGYYRIAKKPAATLLHLGPGLANGLSSLHNAKKANSGVINIVGEHAIDHIALNAPLTADIEGLARPVSHWVHTTQNVKNVGVDAAKAIVTANEKPAKIATLILPSNTAWEEGGIPAESIIDSSYRDIEGSKVDAARDALKQGSKTLLFLGGPALDEHNLRLAGQVAAATGCALMTEMQNSRLERGAGRIEVNRVPYVVEKAVGVLKNFRHMILIGARAPVAFFAYPGKPGKLSHPDCQFVEFAGLQDNINAGLSALVEAVGGTNMKPTGISVSSKPDILTGPITPEGIASVLGAFLPEGAIVVDESVTTGREFFPSTAGAPPHVWLNNRGGSIGYGLPVALGAAIAAPERKVIVLESDGSGMYTVQSLWSIARENLDVTILVFSNRQYKILFGELANVGVKKPGTQAHEMFSLTRPDLDWVSLAKGMGVKGARVDSLEKLAKEFQEALKYSGPALIELEM